MKIVPHSILLLLLGCGSSNEELQDKVSALEESLNTQQAFYNSQEVNIADLQNQLMEARAEIEALRSDFEAFESGAGITQLEESTGNNSNRLDALEELDIATQTWVGEQGYSVNSDVLAIESSFLSLV